MRLANRDISNQSTATERNKFDTLQETPERRTPNIKDEIFVTASIEAAAECISAKSRAKCRISWGPLAIRKKQENMKKHPYLIKEIQQKTMDRNLRKHGELTDAKKNNWDISVLLPI